MDEIWPDEFFWVDFSGRILSGMHSICVKKPGLEPDPVFIIKKWKQWGSNP